MQRRNPLSVYKSVVEQTMRACGFADEQTARLHLGAALRQKPTPDWALMILASNDVKAAYLLNHLISLGSWPVEIQEVVGAGLSL